MKKFTILTATVLVTLLSSCGGSKQLANVGYNPQSNQVVVEEDPVGE